MQIARSRASGPQTVSSERRNHRRLRELCDEVLATYRVAKSQDLITEADRNEAQRILSRIAPAFAK